jgi:hypothetical protein
VGRISRRDRLDSGSIVGSGFTYLTPLQKKEVTAGVNVLSSNIICISKNTGQLSGIALGYGLDDR